MGRAGLGHRGITDGAAVWMLAVGQTLGYACFFYVFAALVLSWQQNTDWGAPVLAFGPSLAVAVSALLAPLVGRGIDLGHGARLMSGGAVIGALGLSVMAIAPSAAVYLAAWVLLGAAQAFSLYEPCFSLLVRRFGTAARGPITRVTLVAGFASTLAFPAGAWLADLWGWRGALWVAAVVSLLVIAPLHWLGGRALLASGLRASQEDAAAPAKPQRPRGWVLTLPAFWALAGIFSLINLNHWMLISFLRPILAEAGLAEGPAILAASLVGPAQVLGRLALLGAGERLATMLAVSLTLLGLVVAPVALWFAGAGLAGALIFALVQGAAMGVMTILRPILTAEVLGQQGYGAIAGMLSIPTLAATALAPSLGALLLAQGGAALLIIVAAICAVLALIGATALGAGRSRKGKGA